MKYIRTKNGIYENKPLEKHLGRRKGKGFEIVFKEQDIIAQADTIEELCDEFVSNNKLLQPKYISPKETLIQSWRNRFEEEVVVKGNKNIYGAIWIDKGLIYVAKMNESGELELLEQCVCAVINVYENLEQPFPIVVDKLDNKLRKMIDKARKL